MNLENAAITPRVVTTRSPEQLEYLLNNSGIADFSDYDFAGKGGFLSMIGKKADIVLFDPDALLLFEAMPNPLTSEEKGAINTFIVSEKASGNWDNYVRFSARNLVDPANALFDWIDFDSATNNGATHGPNGYSYDGISQYIATGFTPDTHLGSFDETSAVIGAYIQSFVDKASGLIVPFGGVGGGNRTQPFFDASTKKSDPRLNQTFATAAANNTYLASDQLLVLRRTGSTAGALLVDGVVAETFNDPSTGLTTVELSEGGQNNNGTQSSFFEGTIGVSFAASASAFNYTANNTNVRVLAFSLSGGFDPDAQLVIDAMDSPTSLQQEAINTFIVQDKIDGNWALRDDFSCGAFGDVTPSNGLLKWKSLEQMTAFGGLTISINGWGFNGTNSYINTNFNPSTDGVNYNSSNSFITAFIKGGAQASSTIILGAYDGTRSTQFFDTATDLQLKLTNKTMPGVSSSLPDNTLLSVQALTGSNKTFLDGVEAGTIAASVGSLVTEPLFLGARNTSGAASLFSGKTISTFSVGGGDGFNQLAHDSNVRNLLTTLGTLP